MEAVTDKGYHSNDTLTALAEAEVRTYVSEPDRGRRRWQNKPEAQQAVYSNRRRIHGEHGKQLLRRRGEFLERSFAHAYETGGMRRVYLRGRENVLETGPDSPGRIQSVAGDAAGVGKGDAARLQGYSAEALLMGLQLWIATLERAEQETPSSPMCGPSPVVGVTIVIWFAAH